MKKVASVEAMREFGRTLASSLRAGDLLVLEGPLGAGKTALTQGIGLGLGIDDVTSPTFVIARTHQGRIPLIHVDAYRLLGSESTNFEFDDLDLEAQREKAITVVEWGGEVASRLSDEYLQIVIFFGQSEDERTLDLIGHGPRWQDFRYE